MTNMKWSQGFSAGILTSFFLSATAVAGDAAIVDASASQRSDGSYSFSVTVKHADAGWDHYADGWEIISPDGDVLGKRVLMHPHVNEQPFTRSLSGVSIPAEVARVKIRVHDSVHGYAASEFELTLPAR